MGKTGGATALPAAAAVADPHAQSPEQEAPEHTAARVHRACGACLRVAVAVFVGCSFAATAWRVRHDPQNLAFVVSACSLLVALLLCLRRAERLTPDSPVGERRRVQAAVWFLSTALSCAFAYRVAAVMPPAAAVLVWCMTALVVLTGFCLLVLCRDEEYQCLDDVDTGAAGDAKPFNKTRPNDELV